MKNKNWFEEINIARGIGVLLVMLGHAFPDTAIGIKNAWAKGLFDIIYSFHIPLFIFMSGFVADKVLKIFKLRETQIYIISRAKRLLIPYFFLTICYLPMKLVMSKFANVPYDLKSIWEVLFGESPDYALWTLYTLFLLSVFSALFVNEKNIKYWVIVFLVIYIVYTLCNIVNVPVGLGMFFERGVWYFLGLLVRIHYRKIKEYYENRKKLIVLLPSVIFIVANIIKGIFDFPYKNLLIIFTASTGIILILSISCFVGSCSETNICKKIFSELGKYSMDIYVLSTFIQPVVRMVFWSMMRMNYVLCVIVSVVLGAIVSIAISKYIIRKVPIFRKLMLGIE